MASSDRPGRHSIAEPASLGVHQPAQKLDKLIAVKMLKLGGGYYEHGATACCGGPSLLGHSFDFSPSSAKAAADPLSSHPVRAIHSVKGMEFPAVCVVMTTATAKGILDALTGGARR
jgi:hypothetical protein